MANRSNMGASAKGGVTAGVLLGGAVCLLALPSAVLAFTTRFEPRSASAANDVEPMDARADAHPLARAIPIRSLAKGKLFPFTPAGTPNRPDRSVTVAVRVDAITVQAIRIRRNEIAQASEAGPNPLRIAPTAFNLGVSRGYQNFSQSLVPSADPRKIDMPDLSRFSLSAGHPSGDPARFSPRIVIDEKPAAGRAPRTFAADGGDLVDVGGAYRVTRNLDVTAGVRYSQERERLRPLTDGKQDGQAVYVGTQFRF